MLVECQTSSYTGTLEDSVIRTFALVTLPYWPHSIRSLVTATQRQNPKHLSHVTVLNPTTKRGHGSNYQNTPNDQHKNHHLHDIRRRHNPTVSSSFIALLLQTSIVLIHSPLQQCRKTPKPPPAAPAKPADGPPSPTSSRANTPSTYIREYVFRDTTQHQFDEVHSMIRSHLQAKLRDISDGRLIWRIFLA